MGTLRLLALGLCVLLLPLYSVASTGRISHLGVNADDALAQAQADLEAQSTLEDAVDMAPDGEQPESLMEADSVALEPAASSVQTLSANTNLAVSQNRPGDIAATELTGSNSNSMGSLQSFPSASSGSTSMPLDSLSSGSLSGFSSIGSQSSFGSNSLGSNSFSGSGSSSGSAGSFGSSFGSLSSGNQLSSSLGSGSGSSSLSSSSASGSLASSSSSAGSNSMSYSGSGCSDCAIPATAGQMPAKIVDQLSPNSRQFMNRGVAMDGGNGHNSEFVIPPSELQDPKLKHLVTKLQMLKMKMLHDRRWIDAVHVIIQHYNQKIGGVEAGLRSEANLAMELKAQLLERHKYLHRQELEKRLIYVDQQLERMRAEANSLNANAGALDDIKASLSRDVNAIQGQLHELQQKDRTDEQRQGPSQILKEEFKQIMGM